MSANAAYSAANSSDGRRFLIFFCFFYKSGSIRSRWISTAASPFLSFWGLFAPPKQIRTGLSNTLTWECVHNVASNWWQEGLKKSCTVICGFFLFRYIPHILTLQFCPHLYWKARVGLRARLGEWNEGCLFCIHRTLVSLMHVPIFSGCITCKLLIVAHQRQNFACPGLADGAIALMKNGVGVIVKFIHLESSTFPQTGKTAVRWGNLYLGNSI